MYRKYNRKQIGEFAKTLRDHLPSSEVWFFSLYDRHYKIQSDLSNHRFSNYIPDIINKDFKYIIEIDGSVHNKQKVIDNDVKKTKIYNNLGYKVFRVRHFNIKDYIELISNLIEIRGHLSKPSKEYNELKEINKGKL